MPSYFVAVRVEVTVAFTLGISAATAAVTGIDPAFRWKESTASTDTIEKHRTDQN
jgi:hypothetical protein